jgi:hypothetical protein
MIRLFAAMLALACLLSPADAKSRHHAAVQSHASCVPTFDLMRPCAYQPDFLAGIRSIKVSMHRERRAANPRPRQARQTTSTVSMSPVSHFSASNDEGKRDSAVLAHPTGCPVRAFCGCGAAVRVFGHSIRNLWLAANWFKFPRAAPSVGMVAVKRHHVFVLEQHLGGDTWLAYDANSGRHLTRLHARSIAGFAIVNPRAG